MPNKLLILIVFFTSILFLIVTRVSKIECFLNNTACPESLLKHSTKILQSSFFFGNFEKDLSNNSELSSIYSLASYSKSLPGTVTLNFIQEETEYQISIQNEIFQIGNSGKELPNQENALQVPVFMWYSDQTIIDNKSVLPNYHNIFLSVSKSLQTIHANNAKIAWNSDSEIVVTIQNEPQFIFDKDSIETRSKKIDRIISARELDELKEPISEIDMRFDLPVLRTRQ